MTTHILKLVCFSALALLLGCSHPITTIVLVRHADRQGDLDQLEPVLGTARANELARVLADANITAIYSTDKARTRATAEPLAKRLGIPVRTYEPDSSQLTVFAKNKKGTPGRSRVGGRPQQHCAADGPPAGRPAPTCRPPAWRL
ncbi:MAG: histidine phosphatase family protein [Saprospiraceae bacterium]|nr:histidine phosphatase family protein [Saprospiraceae bacterium]